MGGITVSAKAEGASITTTVFTDEAGDYYFPPMEAGKYKVWAQALSFETAKGDVDLGSRRKHDITLQPMTDLRGAGAADAGRPHPRRPPRGNRRRQAHEAHLPQQLHELPHAELHAPAPLR
jgi:hypothetical protein